MPARSLVIVVLAACVPAPSAPRDATPVQEPLEATLARLDPSPAPRATLERSRVLRALGRHTDALVQLETALEDARRRLDWRGLSDLWREQGDVQIELARPQDALDSYAKRLTNARSLNATSDRALAQVDLAYAFALLSQWRPAQHALEDAEVLARSTLEADAESLEKMAYVREKLLARELAITLFDKARALHMRDGNATGAARAAASKAYLEALEHDSAAPLASPTLDALVAQTRDPEARLRLLRYRGEAAYLFERDYPRCLAIAEQGQPLAAQRGIRSLTKAMNMLASVCAARLDNIPQAVAAAERAVASSEDEWASTSVPSARQALGFEALLLYRHILALDIKLPGPDRVAAAFAAMEKARARAHIDAAVRGGTGLRATAVEVPALLATNKRELEAHVAELDKQILAGHDDPRQLERRRDALWALDDIKAAIAYQNPLITRMRTPRPATLARTRDLLDDNTVLLAFLMTGEQTVAIAITHRDARLFVVDGGPSALTAQVAQLRDQALVQPRAAMENVRAGGNALYHKLLSPIADLLATHPRLIVLPHGALSLLPFEALVDDQGRFVVETHQVTYSQSATLALEDARAKPAPAGRRAFVGLGDPVYDWSAFKAGRPEGPPAEPRGDARGLRRYLDVQPATRVQPASSAAPTNTARTTNPANTARTNPANTARTTSAATGATRAGLDRLPGTARELTAIAALFGADAKTYLRDQASEENVKAGILSRARLIHIASHGLFETDYQALALTLRPDAPDDGLLLQSEIAELKLDADLVVLSACETGRAHEVLAEPVSGLALALRTAGARRMIASLWSVDDDATVELMTSFYAQLTTSGASTTATFAEALTAAKRKLAASTQWRHPFYWAPFVLVGN